MSTSTDTKPNGDVADDSASTATGGDNTVTDDSSKKITDLEKQLSNLAAKNRKSDGVIKELTTKLDALLSRLPSPDDDDDSDDDDDDADDGEGADSEPGDKNKQRADKGNSNPELRRTLKKLDKARKDNQAIVASKDAEIQRWKDLYAGQNKSLMLRGLLIKHDVLPEYQDDLIDVLGRKIESHLEDDGSFEYSHSDYPSVAKYVEEYLNEKPLYVRNSRRSGTGDGGGAERNGSSGDGLKLPNGYNTWSPARKREWIGKLDSATRNAYLKQWPNIVG